ncbi:MAG: RnfABCDGE type electron transport complex subunit G [Flammeovirgaceae bacterium]|jgi:electron transport complex protein RnfG|nr:RnfABCDGE type electron transport complex subunit G [Flammeovirgaceae bacterium]
MATIKSTFLNLVITLAVITLVGSLALGYVFQWTKEPIAKAQMEKQLRAIEAVVKGYDNNPVTEKFKVATPDGSDSLEFFPAKKGGQLIGMAVKTKSSKGYAGDIWLMIGFNMQGEIQRAVVIEHKETPGLGSKMTGAKFLDQFLNKNPGSTNLKVKKDGGSIDAITGATISSRAFSEAVQRAYETFQSMNYGNAAKQ